MKGSLRLDAWLQDLAAETVRLLKGEHDRPQVALLPIEVAGDLPQGVAGLDRVVAIGQPPAVASRVGDVHAEPHRQDDEEHERGQAQEAATACRTPVCGWGGPAWSTKPRACAVVQAWRDSCWLDLLREATAR